MGFTTPMRKDQAVNPRPASHPLRSSLLALTLTSCVLAVGCNDSEPSAVPQAPAYKGSPQAKAAVATAPPYTQGSPRPVASIDPKKPNTVGPDTKPPSDKVEAKTLPSEKERADPKRAAQWSVPGEKSTQPRQKTPSGLMYEVIRPGSGALPQAGQTVTVHYTGWLMDGSKFDSSVDKGKPYEFVLGQHKVIAGWDEGLALMKVGEKRKLVVPTWLGYGSKGAGAAVPPDSTLVFDVELLSVK